MADNSRRGGRSRPDSKAMWEESEQRSRYGGGGGARDRRDDRDRYRDDGPRHRDRKPRSRSRSPLNDRRDHRDRRDRDRDRDRMRDRDYDRDQDRDRRRGYDRERDRDNRRRDDNRDEDGTARGRRGDHRRSETPNRSPLRKVARTNHDSHSPLPTRTRQPNNDSGKAPARDGPNGSRNHVLRDSVEKEEDRGRKAASAKTNGDDAMDEDDEVAVEDDEMSAMQAMMGFGGFGTTKGQKVPGNNSGAVYKAKKTEYRQYMNRIGGFNRPLSPGR
ncbi:hypothetical protein F5Y17DRAFT_96588 [Xylariaceae sp. FL0594]|nr:hypothetical protein F5Y17DRAFT_96588 [Xylariaceae sp. FL0594]